MENSKENLPVNQFYKGRENFCILGLTGLEGSGSSELLKIISNKDFFNNNTRKIEDLSKVIIDKTDNEELFHDNKNNHSEIGKLIFQRKYTICYNYISKNYKPFDIIEYNKVVWLYTVLFLSTLEDVKTLDDFYNKIMEILRDKFKGSQTLKFDDEYKNRKQINICSNLFDENEFKPLYKLLSEINTKDFLYFRGDDASNLSKIFFNPESEFNIFYKYITEKIIALDYYYFVYFNNRLSTTIRTFGDPTIKSSQIKEEKDCDKIFSIVTLINVLIKGKRYKKNDEIKKNKECRIVIDKINNSLEATFLKERYNAFYLVSISSDNRKNNLKKEIKDIFSRIKECDINEKYLELLTDTIIKENNIESDNSGFSNGFFSHPNISQCVSDSEIHISNNYCNSKDEKPNLFHTLEEQWMKYASLIQHPGLITPSSEERCMIVAYTAKLNSGCLSRKVGAVITNKDHSIRSIGWNDVPYGQIPCSLRDINDIINNKNELLYSDFEKSKKSYYDSEKSFKDKVKEDFGNLNSKIDLNNGLSIPYCFKTLDNKYSGEKNQVYTRSLHAEENTMLQMVKYGGESLTNGVIYVTASPCELCSKKLYQIGIRKIVYIDDYPGISKDQIINSGFKRPKLKKFQGAYGSSYFKLYHPFIPLKDELSIRMGGYNELTTVDHLFEKIMKEFNLGDAKATYTSDEVQKILETLKNKYDEK